MVEFFALCLRLTLRFAKSAQLFLPLGGQPADAGDFFADGFFLRVQLGLLGGELPYQVFVCRADAAGVGEKAAFLIGIGVFQQQGKRGLLRVFIVGGDKGGNLGFGAADVGLQLGQFSLQGRQFLPTGLFLAVEAGNFAAGAGNSGLCFTQCPLRFCLRSLFRLQVFFCGGDGIADIAEFGIGGWGGCGKSIWGDKGGAEQQSGEFVHGWRGRWQNG